MYPSSSIGSMVRKMKFDLDVSGSVNLTTNLKDQYRGVLIWILCSQQYDLVSRHFLTYINKYIYGIMLLKPRVTQEDTTVWGLEEVVCTQRRLATNFSTL